jgi:AcrR family transcriptional regulator
MKKSDQTKEKILAAALDEFASKGFAGTRVDQIAQAAGVNKAMIYYHFANKEELFNELFQSEMELLKKELGQVMAQRDVHSVDDMTLAVRDLLEYAGGKKKLLQVLMSGAILSETIQPQLFKLLDFTSAVGLEIAQKGGRNLPDLSSDEILHELFTGLLPLIQFVILRDGLKAYYGWEQERLDAYFIASWLHQHAGY